MRTAINKGGDRNWRQYASRFEVNALFTPTRLATQNPTELATEDTEARSRDYQFAGRRFAPGLVMHRDKMSCNRLESDSFFAAHYQATTPAKGRRQRTAALCLCVSVAS